MVCKYRKYIIRKAGIFMTREEQRIIREQAEELKIELKKCCKEYGLKYAYGYVYKFEGDFVYYNILDICKTRFGQFNYSEFIKPWVLNPLYWEVQEMDMGLMLKQPKTFHFRGAFTLNNIYYSGGVYNIEPAEFSSMIHRELERFCKSIEEHSKVLTGIDVLNKDIEGYRISGLTRALALMYLNDYKSAYKFLLGDDDINEIIHMDAEGKTSREYALEYCIKKLNGLENV